MKRTTIRAAFALALSLALPWHAARAQQDVAGTWQGKLTAAPGTELTIQFIITRGADGALGAVLNSPDMGGVKNAPATDVTFTNNELKLTVASLSGSYTGTLANGAITGQWQQQGQSIPLVLGPPPLLSDADIAKFSGSWVGKLVAGAGAELAIVFRFQRDASGKLQAVLDSPDQGARDIPITDITLIDGKLSFNIPAVRGKYTATLNGDAMEGQWSQGQSMALNMKRGEYQAPVITVALDEAALTKLAGSWRGTLGPLTIVLRFTKTADGKAQAFLDSPNQGAKDLPVTAATLDGDLLKIEVKAVGGNYSGQLAGNTINGTWTQLGQGNPLNLTKD